MILLSLVKPIWTATVRAHLLQNATILIRNIYLTKFLKNEDIRKESVDKQKVADV